MRAPSDLTNGASASPRRRKIRRGSVIVEFALIALVLYIIFAATLEFGRCLFGAQILQQATDVMAREISRTPLPPAITLNDVLTDATGTIDTNHQVRNTIFDSAKLVWSFDDAYAGGLTAAENSASLPIVNQLLLPLMIADNETRTLRYPGLVPDPNNPGNWLIAKVTYNTVSDGDAVFTGSEQSITLVPVVEEIVAPGHKPGDTDYATWSPMNLTATNVPASQRGIVALRINYPFQAATLAATAPLPDTAPDRFAPNFHFLNASGDDPTLGDEPADGDMGVYAGQFQLGNMRVAGQIVRPFRRLISAQAIYRREVF